MCVCVCVCVCVYTNFRNCQIFSNISCGKVVLSTFVLSLICCVSLVHHCTLFSYYSAKLTKSQKIEPFLQTFLLSDDKKGFTGALKRLFKVTKSGNPKPDSHYLLHFQPLEGLPSLSRLNRWLNNVNVFPNKILLVHSFIIQYHLRSIGIG